MSTDRMSELLWNYLHVTGRPEGSWRAFNDGPMLRGLLPAEIIQYGQYEATRFPADVEQILGRPAPSQLVPGSAPAPTSAVGSSGHAAAPGHDDGGRPHVGVTSMPLEDGSASMAAHLTGAAASAAFVHGVNGQMAGGGGPGAAGPAFQHGGQDGLDGRVGGVSAAGPSPIEPPPGDKVILDNVQIRLIPFEYGSSTQIVEAGGNVQVNTVEMRAGAPAGNAAYGNASLPGADMDGLIASARDLAKTSGTSDIEIHAFTGTVSWTMALEQRNEMADQDKAALLSAGVAHPGEVSVGSIGFVGETASGGNELHNSAVLHNGSGYDLIVVTGNYYEVNLIVQMNLVIDEDANVLQVVANQGLSAGSMQHVQSGANTLINKAAIIDGNSDPGYQLIGGTYKESFAIEQGSRLIDGDGNALTAALGPAGIATVLGQQFASSGGNYQANHALFGSVPVSGSAHMGNDLGRLLADGDLSLDRLQQWQAFRGEPLKVLFVDGDYYDINMIVQINILHDNDVTSYVFAAGAHKLSTDGFVSMDFTQLIHSGGNTVTNFAAIFDDNGGFRAQVVGGNYHEINQIVQNNILYDGDSNVVNTVAGGWDGLGYADELSHLIGQHASLGDGLSRFSG